ncbi:IS110 family transposase [Pantoea sp. GM01]|uniref:IS110 family transposase n=1 Tax=Pantoea sp. GM01 TaxID=1144320 RepID=UPI00068FBABC
MVVGIDVAMLKFDAAVWLGETKYKTKVFANTPKGFELFIAWLQPYQGSHLCMEATGSYYFALATFLYGSGWTVSVVNPFQIHSFGKSEIIRNKTDQVDARLIARFCASHKPQPWQPAPLNERQLLALVRRLEGLREMRQIELNRLGVADDVVKPSIFEIIEALTQQISETEKKIKKHIDADPVLRQRKALLTSIPGIGDILSASLIGYLGDMSQFSNSGKVVAYAGLNPYQKESGKWQGQSHISKRGCANLRKALYMPALTAMTFNPVVKSLRDRMLARGQKGKVVVCAAMRKLLQIAYGVLKSGQPFDEKVPLAKT